MVCRDRGFAMFERTKNDNDLVRASLQGSPKAFGVLVGRYQSLVCAITYSATSSVEKSEELAQEVFLRAWRSLSQLQDLSKFRPWLCSIARSTVQNWFRDRQRDVVGRAAPLDAAADMPSEESGPEEAAMIQEQKAVVQQALAEIPEALREPLILFYREQKSIQEVARQFDLTENTARQRISRGRRLLRKQVAHMVETTLARTRPGKAFTTAVLVCIAGTAGKSSAAVAVVGAASAAGQSAGLASLLSGATARIAAVAAGLALVTAGFLAYRQFVRSAEPAGPDLAATTITGESPTESRSNTRFAAVGTRPDAMRLAEPRPGVPMTVLESVSEGVGRTEDHEYRLLMSRWKGGSYVAERTEDTVSGCAEPGAGDGGVGTGVPQDRPPARGGQLPMGQAERPGPL
jgi:RNA polymerase sigma factor (sigma-70 family)